MKAYRYIFILVFASVLFFTGCRKAGNGGSAGLNIHVTNGNINARYALVHLKYNAKTFPGPNASYDEFDTCDYAGRHSFTHLKRGHYYVYVRFTDSTNNMAVYEGGAHYKIRNGLGETHIVIDLSEEDPY